VRAILPEFRALVQRAPGGKTADVNGCSHPVHILSTYHL